MSQDNDTKSNLARLPGLEIYSSELLDSCLPDLTKFWVLRCRNAERAVIIKYLN